MVPAVVPIFRKLGIEERVAAIGVYKPGASFFHTTGHRIDFSFKTAEGPLPGYAYNVPRPALDNLLEERARELGAEVVRERALLDFDRERRLVSLRKESLSAAGFVGVGRPDLLVDATGRTRAFARGLDLPSRRGGRDDVSYFAHYEGFRHDEVPDGQIIITALTRGWSWRIPLQGRLSVGVVLDRKEALRLGRSPAERLEAIIAREPLLREHAVGARRVSKVMTYANYQLISEVAHGRGWVLAGDALGFVDPMLSPGLFMAMESAWLLDEKLFAKGEKAFSGGGLASGRGARSYASAVGDWHRAWSDLILYFYSGEIFQFYWAGQEIVRKHGEHEFTHKMERHVNRLIARMASGGATRSFYGRNLLRFFARYMLADAPPKEEFSVR